ncbi:unnamed protein product [Arabidopsis halleri]
MFMHLEVNTEVYQFAVGDKFTLSCLICFGMRFMQW